MRRSFHVTGRAGNKANATNDQRHELAAARFEQMKLMRAQGKTHTEIARALGVSVYVVAKYFRRYA